MVMIRNRSILNGHEPNRDCDFDGITGTAVEIATLRQVAARTRGLERPVGRGNLDLVSRRQELDANTDETRD